MTRKITVSQRAMIRNISENLPATAGISGRSGYGAAQGTIRSLIKNGFIVYLKPSTTDYGRATYALTEKGIKAAAAIKEYKDVRI